MPIKGEYFVYILSSISKRIYVGVTNDLFRRVWEHKFDSSKSFTHQYRISKLVYFEQHSDINQAIVRETQLKNFRREKKVALIEEKNPLWKDLALEWYTRPH